MICPNCKNEIPDDSVFCKKCGEQISSLESNQTAPEITTNKTGNKKKPARFVISILAVMLVIVLGYFGYDQMKLNQVIKQYKGYLLNESFNDASAMLKAKKGSTGFERKAKKTGEAIFNDYLEKLDYESAGKLLNSGILDSDKKFIESVEESVCQSIISTEQEFVNGTIEYTDFREAIEVYDIYKDKKISDQMEESRGNVDKLNQSRVAYSYGLAALDKNQYQKALEELSKVIETDTNYSDAQLKITETTSLYKTEVMEKVDSLVAENDYVTAIDSLTDLKKYSSDSDISSKLSDVEAKKEVYDNEQEEIKKQRLEEEQQVAVTSCKTYNVGYNMIFMRSEVHVQNKSDKVAKDVELTMLLFDGNGYPVDVEWKLYQGEYENSYNCAFNSCNIQPGGTYGDSQCFDVPDQCKQVKACVSRVEYIDGSVWTNPYHEYWIKENYRSY